MSAIPNSYAAKDAKYHAHGQSNWRVLEQEGALIMDRADGVIVYDETGKDYVEAMAGLWSTSLGFSEERLVNAATEQMRKLPLPHLQS